MNTNARASLANPISFQNYRDLPAGLYRESNPTPTSAPSLIELNQNLLELLGVDTAWFRSDHGLSILSGNAVNDDNRPVAMGYSGHQFGHWVPQLGDGRAHMLGQLAAADGSMVDVQLKGSGRTPYSRGGDGRATLGAVIREYVVSEAMAGLGIPTTRSIAMLGTGEDVFRERAFSGAVLVRSAASHIRVGTFQYAAATLDGQGVAALADFVIANHFPELVQTQNPYLDLLDAVVERQASLIAQWMLVGFIHGVMNTDNMSIVGETIDYGPCAFMDEFQPNKVFSSIDRNGRYAWDRQVSIGYWNLARFAETLLPLIHETPDNAAEMAGEVIGKLMPLFGDKFHSGMRTKLGLTETTDEVTKFANTTLTTLAGNDIDFTVFFDCLTRVAAGEADSLLLGLFPDEQTGNDWANLWRAHRSKGAEVQATMRRANPAVIARNHRVQQAIDVADNHGDLEPFRRLCRVLSNPFEIGEEDQELQTPPLPDERVTQTFCGT